MQFAARLKECLLLLRKMLLQCSGRRMLQTEMVQAEGNPERIKKKIQHKHI